MIQLLDIKPEDTFLDLCTGTGSFAIEALTYKPESIVAVEYQTKLYNLLKCNFLLRGVDLKKNELIQGDCFEYDFKATKSAINPPYGSKCGKYPLDFVIKQLESVCEGGLVCAIIPKSKLNSNKPNNKFKKKIMELGRIKTIINCNPKLFYPSTEVPCCIILIEKRAENTTDESKAPENYFINLIDYSDDGFKIEIQYGLKMQDNYNTLYKNIIDIIKNPLEENMHILRLNNDWCYLDNVNPNNVNPNNVTNSEYNLNLTNALLENLERRFLLERRNILERDNVYKILNYKSFKISDLFTLKRGSIKIKDVAEGQYPLITSSGKNKGIVKYINSFKYENCITVANNGNIASSFYHDYKFNCTADVTVLIPKNPLDPQVMKYICIELLNYKDSYNYGRKWNIAKMQNDIINIPYKNNTYNLSEITKILQKYNIE